MIGRLAKCRWRHLPPGGTGATPPYLKMFSIVICITIPSFTLLIQSARFFTNPPDYYYFYMLNNNRAFEVRSALEVVLESYEISFAIVF